MEIIEEQFPLESEVQRLTEANLQDLFDLGFVRSEFELHGLRIDTLAFDNEFGANPDMSMSACARAYLADMYGRDWIPMHQNVSISSYDDESTYYSYAMATGKKS